MISICINFPDGIPIKLAPKKGYVCEGINDMLERLRYYNLPPYARYKYWGKMYLDEYDICGECEE